ncbi:MAG: hypothetical protein VYA34_11440 [Myxococcota bacterium]|nr:hypothetical protein [Myxococcota bacterium]
MANNISSFKAFTQTPANISEHGATIEELKSQGTPDPNPLASPMATSAAADVGLAMKPRIETQRDPNEPMRVNHFNGPSYTHMVSRDAVAKLANNALLNGLGEALANPELQMNLSSNARNQLQSLLRKVGAMAHDVQGLNKQVEQIYARFVSHQQV